MPFTSSNTEMDLSSIPLYDHHCHGLQVPLATCASFRSFFSESTDPDISGYVAETLFYRRGIRDLAAFLGCGPVEDEVCEARNLRPFESHARELFIAAGISVACIDTGYRRDVCYDLDAMRSFLPCRIHEILRLESLIEQLILETPTFDDLEEAYRAVLWDARSQGVVALKTIAAYRGGLRIETYERTEAMRIYVQVLESARRDGLVRLEARPLLDYLLRTALEIASVQEMPVQFHAGFGDDDSDLRDANPLHLRPLFRDPALKGVRFVLLHNYPFIREAGCLAGLHSNVYVDLSLTVPFIAHGGVEAILAALELAPTTRVLLGTDAAGVPERFYLSALYAREAVGMALDRLIAEGWVERDEIEILARRFLYENAARLYGA